MRCKRRPHLSCLKNSQKRRSTRIPASPFRYRSLRSCCSLSATFCSARTGNLVLSGQNTDTATEFVYWRQFGFDQLRQCHLALWDPHVFSGVPFFGGWQAALLYPPNWIYLFLPLARAINWEIAISVFLAGWFTALLARRNNASPMASVLAGAMVMLGGPFFFHVYAGHLCTLDAMAWLPLVLLAIDEMCDTPSLRPALIGSGAMAMQILAGHPQTVFITGITAIVYGAIRVFQSKERVRAALGSVGFVALGIGIAAIQLLSGLGTAKEGVRQGAVTYAFASSLSFPPENLLTFLVPNLFGNAVAFPYWGRWYPWEMCAFVGIGGLTLAITGIAANWKQGQQRTWAAMALLLALICLGGYTPLFHLLYNFVPGFNKFRSHSKFIFAATVFVALLAASGMDSLLRDNADTALRKILVGLGALCIVLYAGAFALTVPSIGQPLIKHIFAVLAASLDQTFVTANTYDDSRVGPVISFASAQIAIAATVCLFLAVVTWSAMEKKRSIYIFAAVAMIELVVFARSTVATFDINSTVVAPLQQYLASNPGDYRIMQIATQPNSAIAMGASDVWGYDPTVTKRYAEFMAMTQGQNPNEAGEYLSATRYSPPLALLRLQYVIAQQHGHAAVLTMPPHLPHAVLMDTFYVAHGRDTIFQLLNSPGFNFARTAVIEKDPVPMPHMQDGPIGDVKITSPDPNSLLIDVNATRAALLVVTDTYSAGWTAIALPGSVQQEYEVIPADYALRAIPLGAGRHRILMSYAPPGFAAGRAISIISLLIYLSLTGAYLIKRKPAEVEPEKPD